MDKDFSEHILRALLSYDYDENKGKVPASLIYEIADGAAGWVDDVYGSPLWHEVMGLYDRLS